MSREPTDLTRRSVLRRTAFVAGAASLGTVGFAGTAAATFCPRTPGYWANKNWCEVTANPTTGTSVAESLGLTCVDGEPTGTYSFRGGPALTAPEWQKFLVAPTRGDKGKKMAQLFLATNLNYQLRPGTDSDCIDKEIDLSAYGLGTTTVREVKSRAGVWLDESNWPGEQRSWMAGGVDGEPLKDVLDAFANGTLPLDCDCNGE